jgi:hypothetical protein
VENVDPVVEAARPWLEEYMKSTQKEGDNCPLFDVV